LAQVCRITRERIVRGKTSTETVYAITSLTSDGSSAESVGAFRVYRASERGRGMAQISER